MSGEHAYDPTREGAPQMCLCGNAFRTREEVREHVRHPEPAQLVAFPRSIAPAEAWDYYKRRRQAA